MTKRTEITIEQSRRLVIHRSNCSLKAWCETCLNVTPMITPAEAAAVRNVSSRIIYRWIEEGKLHFIEAWQELLICAESLAATDHQINLSSVRDLEDRKKGEQ